MESNKGPVWGSCRYRDKLLQHRGCTSEGRNVTNSIVTILHLKYQEAGTYFHFLNTNILLRLKVAICNIISLLDASFAQVPQQACYLFSVASGVLGTEPQLSKQGYNGCNTTKSRQEEEIPIHKHDRAAGPACYRCHKATTSLHSRICFS